MSAARPVICELVGAGRGEVEALCRGLSARRPDLFDPAVRDSFDAHRAAEPPAEFGEDLTG